MYGRVGVQRIGNIFVNCERCNQSLYCGILFLTTKALLQFDLVCDRDIYPTIGLAALNVGMYESKIKTLWM